MRNITTKGRVLTYGAILLQPEAPLADTHRVILTHRVGRIHHYIEAALVVAVVVGVIDVLDDNTTYHTIVWVSMLLA